MKSMKFLVSVLLVLVVASLHAAAPALGNPSSVDSLTGEQLQQFIAAGLLLDQDADRTRLGAKTIGQLYADRMELMDYVAEMLNRSTALPQSGKSVDVVAVYAAVLGMSKSPRYRNVLLRARQNKNEEKVNREIDAALELIGKSPADQYSPGSIDVDAKATEIGKTLADNRKSNRDQLMKTAVGSDMSRVLDVLGAPDEVSAITQVGSVGRRAMIVAHYHGQGLVAFRLERDADTQWTVFEVANEKVPVSNYRGNQQWFAQAIASMRGIQYRNLIRFYSQQIQNDAEIIPVLTQRLIVMDDLDDYEQDATKYIPEVLKRTSFPNEASLWEEVKTKAKTKLVRKVAAVRIAQLRKKNGRNN